MPLLRGILGYISPTFRRLRASQTTLRVLSQNLHRTTLSESILTAATMCYMVTRSYTCGHLLNVEFMSCRKYAHLERARCCLTLGRPDADIMPHACKKCIDKAMNELRPFEKTIMWDKCRRMWKRDLEEIDRLEEREAQRLKAKKAQRDAE